jgi:two-component system nitrate/nitrite response regulator NarL
MNRNGAQTLLVIDDHPLFRKGVLQLVAEDGAFAIAGQASGGEEGVALAHSLHPDLILLDLNMKGMNGIATLKALKAADADCRVIMLTVSDNEEDLVAALRAGADGYLLKDTEPEQLLASLKAAAEGRTVLSERLTGLLAHALRQEARPGSAADANLTDAEQRVLACIATGMSNKAIARELDIAEGTVKVHVKHLLKKLSLRSRVEAAVWAVEHGRAA